MCIRDSSRIEAEIGESIEAWDPPPDTVALFGSAARREASAGSDVDLLVVRLDEVDYDDLAWRTQLGDLERMVEERSGNRVQLVEVDQSEFAQAVDTDQPLIESLRIEARTLIGDDVRVRLGRTGRL